MKSNTLNLLIVSAIVAFPLCAHAAGADAGVELAFMPSTMDVTLLNEGGKFVAIDMKKIAKGEKCRMDKDAVINASRARRSCWDDPRSLRGGAV